MSRDLASAFLALARRWPERTAIETPLRQLTFHRMMTSAGAVAELLADRQVGPGSRVGIAMTRNEDTFILMLATWLPWGGVPRGGFQDAGCRTAEVGGGVKSGFLC